MEMPSRYPKDYFETTFGEYRKTKSYLEWREWLAVEDDKQIGELQCQVIDLEWEIVDLKKEISTLRTLLKQQWAKEEKVQ